jgi:hypothetical protein
VLENIKKRGKGLHEIEKERLWEESAEFLSISPYKVKKMALIEGEEDTGVW